MSFFRVINNLFRFNRTNWKAVSLCVLGATVFWLFNALNKNYATDIRFPLHFEFDQKAYASAKPLPREVNINVNGKGWELLRNNLGLNPHLVFIRLEHPAETRRIIGSALPPVIAGQIGNLKINHIVSDTLYLFIEPQDSVKVKVSIDLAGITFKKEYGRTSPVVVLPDSVQLKGPRSLLKNIGDSIVLSLAERKLSSSFREPVQISMPENDAIRKTPSVVEVIFEVGEVTRIRQQVKLELANVPFASRVNLGSDSIWCTLEIPASRIDDFGLESQKIKAVLDLTDASSGQRKSKALIVGLPSYATVVTEDSVRLRLY